MGKYSNWKTKLAFLSVLSVFLVPVVAASVEDLAPFANFLPIYQDPSLATVDGLIFIDREFDENGDWTEVTVRLDLKITNPSPTPLKVPPASVAANYLDGRLANGWIAEEIIIGGHKTGIVPIIAKIPNGKYFNAFMTALFMGGPLNLFAVMTPYIMVDGLLGEPLWGAQATISLDLPVPTHIVGTPPAFHTITRGQVIAGNDVPITISASDVGTGISNRTYIYYSTDDGENWDRTPLTGPEWFREYNGIDIGAYYPIASSDPFDPQTYTGAIPSTVNQLGNKVSYYVYMEDYAGNWEHEDRGNYVMSDIYTYTVEASPLGEDYIDFNYEYEKPLIFRFVDYLEENGINLLHVMYEFGIEALDLAPLFGSLVESLYQYDVDGSYVVGMILDDLIKAANIVADSGLGFGVLIKMIGEELGFTFEDLMDFAIKRIFLPANGDLNELAAETLTAPNYGELENYFENTLGITKQDITDYLFPPTISIYLGDPQKPEYRSIYAIKITLGSLSIELEGGIIKDWEYDDARGGPFANWLDLVRTANATNGQFGGAGLFLKDIAGVDDIQETMMYLLNSETRDVPQKFPASEFTPYTVSTVTMSVGFIGGSLLYVGTKKQLIKRNIIFKNVDKEFGLKKKKGAIKEKTLPLKES